MAAKIKEGLRDITQGVVERLKGGPKYADNLLGESLQDQLRKATAKDLLNPSEELNSQVVDTINQDVANGKDTREIVNLLKKRLRTDNPHKQWLAVLLVGRVMRDCSSSIGIHQEELLQEVARTMARPARPDSSAGRTTRQAAKELLRSYGRAGTSAFRAVNRTAAVGAVGTTPADAAEAAANSEAASVVAEVQMLIEQAQANTELLSEMLLVSDPQQQQQQAGAGASGSAANGRATAGGDEFENELTLELVTEVRELRTLFDAYLEQLQSMSGPEVEAVMMKALEAVDLLDGALALQQDVASNQRELEQQASAAAGPGGSGQAPSAGGAPAQKAAQRDLIDLDDLADALLPQPPPVLEGAAPQPAATAPVPVPAASQPQDPFAGLDMNAVQQHVGSPPVASPPAAHPAAAAYPGAAAAVATTAAAAPGYPQAQPFSYTQQPHVLPAAYGAYGAPAAANPFGGAAAVGAAAPPAVANPNNPFAANQVPSLPYGAAAAPGLTPALSSSNPFAAAAGPVAGPAGGAALPSAHSNQSQSVDAEWNMFFAGRTAAPVQQGQQQ